jgi:hypothetical protein
MWVCLNDAFLSIVDASEVKDCLLVRARRKGDIERVFGKAYKVTDNKEKDYRFRADISRAVVATVMMNRVLGIDYSNFKNSVANHRLHNAYLDFWLVMANLQDDLTHYAKGRKIGF